jgi:hypothetical protein
MRKAKIGTGNLETMQVILWIWENKMKHCTKQSLKKALVAFFSAYPPLIYNIY